MVNLSKLKASGKTTEIGTASGRIITEYDKGDWSTDAHLTGIFIKLKPETVNLTKAINRQKAESTLEEKDELRDNKFRAVNFIVQGFIQHSNAAINSAAKKVDEVFERYGLEIVNESYATESSLIESMLEDFAEPEIQTAIAALPGLSQMIDDLRSAQTAFEEAQVLFEKEKAKEGSEETATVIKKKILSIINDKLIVHLRAMVNIDETKYGEFAATVAQIIDDINLGIKKRKKGGNTNTETGNGTTPPSV